MNYDFELEDDLQINTLSIEDICYIAGLFDGEGCVGVYEKKDGNRSRFRLLCQLVMTDKLVIHWLCEKTGLGTVTNYQPKGNRKCIYKWSLCSADSTILLLKIVGFLRVKKQQAELALELSYIQKFSNGRYKHKPMRQFEIKGEIMSLNNVGNDFVN